MGVPQKNDLNKGAQIIQEDLRGEEEDDENDEFMGEDSLEVPQEHEENI